MPAIVYPASLPGPQTAPFTPAERLRRSELPGLQQHAARERDFRGTQELSFLYGATEAAVFDEWWRDTLFSGGLLFAAAWPLPPAFADLYIRKFRGSPAWSYVADGNWRVSFTVEVYGRGELPQGGGLAIGWHAPDVGNFFNAPALNQYGQRAFEAQPLYAGIVGYVSGAVVWTNTWSGLTADPSMLWGAAGPTVALRFEDFRIGEGTLSATVNAAPAGLLTYEVNVDCSGLFIAYGY